MMKIPEELVVALARLNSGLEVPPELEVKRLWLRWLVVDCRFGL